METVVREDYRIYRINKIILIFAPGHAGHDVDAIAVVAPGADARRQIGVNAVNNGHIRAQIAVFAPRFSGLETRALEKLIRVAGKRRGIFRGRQS